MKKISVGKTKKPNVLLYYTVVPILKLYYRLVYHHTIDKSAIRKVKAPYLVIAGHGSWLDYIFTSTAMFPTPMNYVGAYNFFRDRILKSIMNAMGVIPKYQFTNDLSAIRKIKYCIDQGRVVALFPHGCLSNDGRPGGYAVFGIAKLIKMLSVPVVALRTDGGYLTRPRWSKKARRGRIETQASLLFTADEVKTLTAQEIYNQMTVAIYYDDYKWQRDKMIPFHGNKIAEGVEYVLYKCPKCESEFTLRSEGDRLFCMHCGNAVRMNRYLLFDPESIDTVWFDGIDRWYDYQSECLAKEIKDPSFKLNADTELQFNEASCFGYQSQGYGEVTLTRDAIVYQGQVKGQSTEIVLQMKNIPMIPFAANEYIEVAIGHNIHRFIFEDKHHMIKWVMAVRQIRDEFYEDLK